MIIRSLRPEHIDKIRTIWKDQYEEEFEFPDFFNKFLSTFAVINNDDVVVVGGIRTIAEAVIITDKSLPAITRGRALEKVLELSKISCALNGYDQLHAFVPAGDWQEQLKRHNFNHCKFNALYTNIEE